MNSRNADLLLLSLLSGLAACSKDATSLSPQASNLIFISQKLLCNANRSIFRERRVDGAHFQCTGHGIGNSLSLRNAPCHTGVEVSHGIRSTAPFLRACVCSVSSAKEKKETWQALIPFAWMCCDRLQAAALRAVCMRYFGAFSASAARAPCSHQLGSFVHGLQTPRTVGCSNNQCCGKPVVWDLFSVHRLWHTPE